MAVSFSDEIFDTICERLAIGMSLVKICEAKDMPSRAAVNNWLRDKPEILDRYARAREMQADYYVQEIMHIVDTATDAQIARLRMDARKWTASKLAPKKYGDKLTTELTGANGASLVPVINITTSNG